MYYMYYNVWQTSLIESDSYATNMKERIYCISPLFLPFGFSLSGLNHASVNNTIRVR